MPDDILAVTAARCVGRGSPASATWLTIHAKDRRRGRAEGIADAMGGANDRLGTIGVLERSPQLLDESGQRGVGHIAVGPEPFVELGLADDARGGRGAMPKSALHLASDDSSFYIDGAHRAGLKALAYGCAARASPWARPFRASPATISASSGRRAGLRYASGRQVIGEPGTACHPPPRRSRSSSSCWPGPA